MVSSRGCPYRCNWCAKPIYGDNYHCRSPRRVAEEMRELKTRFRPDHLWFADDIFALSPQWTREFADAVEALDARIPFKMQSRCDLMTRDTVAALRRAGCAEVWMGAESGSQNVLDAMDKGTRALAGLRSARESAPPRHPRLLLPAVRLSRRDLGRHREDHRAGARDAARRHRRLGLLSAAGHRIPPHGSSQLGSKKNWDDSDDLAMMFHGAFTSEFYRALPDALHAEVRKGRDAAEEAWAIVDVLKETCARKQP